MPDSSAQSICKMQHHVNLVVEKFLRGSAIFGIVFCLVDLLRLLTNEIVGRIVVQCHRCIVIDVRHVSQR